MEFGMDRRVAYGQSAYGAADTEAIFGDKRSSGGLGAKGSFVHGQRRRLNARPILLAVLAPWLLFAVVYAVLCFDVRYEEPGLAWAVVALGFLAVVFAGLLACSASGRWFANAEHEPTWLIFIFLSCLLAFLTACALGAANYEANFKPFFHMKSLNNYTNVSPARMRGQQLMDVGIVQFAADTRLDISKSMGFKTGSVYCVAPIVQGDEPLTTYDFWAIGKDCCSGSQSNFHCKHFNNPHANGGFRLMADGDRPFYRLAVQQAEATYNIKAAHPLFFEWEVDPVSVVNGWRMAGKTEYLVW
eukprot:CAMPEP_0176040750 /NCGR_PEP_ID=MMETSP0120_2-20121206/20209_1 /TAXON_ID=160619 /ORGANISM="Kryptoperidinium foliaceum, Strain CCMP 1326" /LENGTH=300 /DNA_ID=CAMNT_0017374151 /DNA_START=6 /DNA_END=905 /DNA_ORIENTATION=-